MPDFMEALNKKVEDTVKPPPKPKGHFLSVISGLPKPKEIVAQGETRNILAVPIKMVAPKDDVDADALEEAGDIASWPPFTKDFWDYDQPAGEWAMKKFLTEVLELDISGKTYSQAWVEANGKQLTSELENYPYQNKDTGEAEIGTRLKSTAKV